MALLENKDKDGMCICAALAVFCFVPCGNACWTFYNRKEVWNCKGCARRRCEGARAGWSARAAPDCTHTDPPRLQLQQVPLHLRQ